MKHLFALLFATFALSAFGKDYEKACYNLSYGYLARESGQSYLSLEAFEERFVEHYRSADERHSLFVEQDGTVLFDSAQLDQKGAEARIAGLADRDGKIVFLVGEGSGGKSERIFKALCKRIHELVEARTRRGVDFDRSPVLIATRGIADDIRAKLLRPETPKAPEPATAPAPPQEPAAAAAPQAGPATPQAAPRRQARPARAEEATAPEASADGPVADTPDDDAQSLTPCLVRVETSLTVRQRPSASSPKVGSLDNGAWVDVAAFSDGWARIRYDGEWAYVKEEYLEPDPATAPHGTASFAGVWRFLLHAMPIAILLLTLLLLLFDGGTFLVLGLCTGVAEILYAAAEQHVHAVSALPWFCTPGQVGWFWTVVDFILLCAVLIAQHEMFKSVVGRILRDSGRSGFGFLFGFLLAYPIVAVVGVAMTAWLVDLSLIWVTLAAFGLLWLLLKWQLGAYFTEALPQTLIVAVMLGGFLVFFLKTAGVLILGGLIYVLLRAMGEGSAASSSSPASSSQSGSASAVRQSGKLEKDAFGGFRIRHNDGSTTEVRDYGGELYDDSGKKWYGNDSHRHS